MMHFMWVIQSIDFRSKLPHEFFNFFNQGCSCFRSQCHLNVSKGHFKVNKGHFWSFSMFFQHIFTTYAHLFFSSPKCFFSPATGRDSLVYPQLWTLKQCVRFVFRWEINILGEFFLRKMCTATIDLPHPQSLLALTHILSSRDTVHSYCFKL